MSGNDWWNSYVLILWQKSFKEADYWISEGRLFQRMDATTGNKRHRPGMGKVRPAGRMRPPDSFCAARRKRFNVRPFKKSWDTRIFQISFIWLWVLIPANSCSHRWMLLRINCVIDLLKTTWCVSYEQVSTATIRVSKTFNTLPIES